MKKKDIIQLVKETIAEGRKRYGQHDYYGNNVGGKNSISGYPGVWEQNISENKAQELADSYSVEELNDRLKQLYIDMEQEAEPEGGPISNQYADEIYQYEEAIRIAKGIGPRDKEAGKSYDEVYLKDKLVGMTDAYEYDKEKGRIAIYPDLGSLQYKSRSTQEIVFTKDRGEIAFVRAFGNRPIYDELKKVLPEIPSPGKSMYSGFINILADDGPIPVGLDTAKAMIDAMKKGKDAEAKSQSDFYTRQPGTGGTGIDEQAPPAGAAPGGAPSPGGGGGGAAPTDPDAKAEKKELDTLEKEKFNVKIKYLNKKKTKASSKAAQASSAAIKAIDKQIQQMMTQRSQVGTQSTGAGAPQPQKENKIMKNTLLSDYLKQNRNSNLKENMNSHKKQARRQVLMEGAMTQFFEYFDSGKTDEEVVQLYAGKGVAVPEQFVIKARKQYENLTKLKMELEMTEKEFRNSAENIVNNPATGLEDGTVTDEDKQLTSAFFENK